MSGSNLYFNNYAYNGEQDLIESLIVETMGIYGHSVYYIPRSLVAKDDIYGEDPISEYNKAFFVDMYIRSFDSFEGDGSFLSKFNLEIRDQTTFTIAKRSFQNEIGQYTDLIRPLEGDLVYSPMLKRLMIIKYVNPTPIFYQMGALQVWDLVCEAFEYSSERFNTGIQEIDEIEQTYSTNEEAGIETSRGERIVDDSGFSLILGQNDFDFQNQDVFADNKELIDESSGVVDWSERDPFSSEIN